MKAISQDVKIGVIRHSIMGLRISILFASTYSKKETQRTEEVGGGKLKQAMPVGRLLKKQLKLIELTP